MPIPPAAHYISCPFAFTLPTTLCTTPYFGERRKVLLRTIFLVIFCFRVADKWRKELGEAEAKEMEAVCRGAIRSHEQLTMLA